MLSSTDFSSDNSAYQLRPLVVALLAAGAVVAFPFDVILSQFFMSDPLPGELRSLIHKTEFFGHGYGILGIAFTIYLISHSRRRELPRLLGTTAVAGILCDAVKMTVHRVRPVDFSFAAGESTFKGLSFLHAESFGQMFESSFHSFPSAHTATSVAFAMALGRMYPQASRWFLVLAATVAISRFDGGAHYVSDTFVGAIIGYATGCWMLGTSKVSAIFARWELGAQPMFRTRRNEPAKARVPVSS